MLVGAFKNLPRSDLCSSHFADILLKGPLEKLEGISQLKFIVADNLQVLKNNPMSHPTHPSSAESVRPHGPATARVHRRRAIRTPSQFTLNQIKMTLLTPDARVDQEWKSPRIEDRLQTG